MAKQTLTRADLELIHEALSYMRKRTFDQAESVRLKGILDRLEEMLLDAHAGPRALRLSPPEQESLARQVETFCVELTRPGGSSAGREQARRLRALVGQGSPGSPRAWWRKLFSRAR